MNCNKLVITVNFSKIMLKKLHVACKHKGPPVSSHSDETTNYLFLTLLCNFHFLQQVGDMFSV